MQASAPHRTTLILASSSPRRRELAGSLGFPLIVRPSHADESTPEGWPPARIVEELALRKASAVRETSRQTCQGPAVVIGSDTIVVVDGRILGKPRDGREAEAMLSRLAGRTHEVYTGLCCIGMTDGERVADDRTTLVRMGACSPEQLRRCVQSEEPTDEAGGCDSTLRLGDIGRYRILSESPGGKPEAMVGHTVSKVTFRPMSDEEIQAYINTGDPLDKAGAYGVQGIGSVFIEKIEGDFYSIMGLPLNLLYQMLLMFGISPFKNG